MNRVTRYRRKCSKITHHVLRIPLQTRECLVVEGILIQTGKSRVHGSLLRQRAQLMARIHKHYLIIQVTQFTPKVAGCKICPVWRNSSPFLKLNCKLQHLKYQPRRMTFQAQKAEKHVTVDAVRSVLDLLDVAIFAQHHDFHIVHVVENISRFIVHLQIWG